MRTKKTVINFITDTIPLLIVSILGIFKFKLFIQFLGNETLGLYQFFSQIMIYIALVDGGLSSAVLYSLYKPNVEEDNKKFNALLAGAFKSFSLIGAIVFGIACVVSFGVPFLIKDCSFDYFYVILTFLLFSLSNVVGYFFVPYNCLLEVKEKKYIYNLTSQIGQIVLSITEIVMLLNKFKFEYILIMHVIVRLLASLVEVYICKKEYPEIKILQKEKEFGFKKHINSLIFHKINGLVSSNIDTIVISSFLGLKYVAIYSTYNYIINMLKNILGKLSSSISAMIGNSLAKAKEKMYEIYEEFNGLLFFIAITICTPLILAIDGFIDIFYEGEIATSFLIAITFVSVLFVFIIKMDTNMFVAAGGLYKETRHCAMADTIVNLILSLTLIHYIGIPGVLIGTTAGALIGDYILKTKVVHNKIFDTSPRKYYFKNMKFFILYILDLIIGYKIISLFTINTILIWFIIFTIFTILNALIILGIFALFKETLFLKRIKILLKRGK